MRKFFNGLALSASLAALTACGTQQHDTDASSGNWYKANIAMDEGGEKVYGESRLLVEEIALKRCETEYEKREISGKSNCAITVLLDNEQGNVSEYFTLAAQCGRHQTWAPFDPLNGTVSCELTTDMSNTIRRKPGVYTASTP